MLSDVDVKMIGELAVPSAIIVPPRAMINEVALAPVPGVALIIVPAGIVKVTPLGTITLLSKVHMCEASNVLFSESVPVNKNSFATSSHDPSSLVASGL